MKQLVFLFMLLLSCVFPSSLFAGFLDTDDTISPAYVTGILYVLIPKVNKVKETIINSNYKLKVDIKDCFDIKLLYMVSDLKEYFHILD